MQVRLAQRRPAARVERRVPGQAGVQRGRQRVLVGRRADDVAAPLLRRRVRRRQPRRMPGLRERVVGPRLGEPEVGEVGVVAARTADQQHVLGLDVAMDDAAPVRPVQRPGDLRDDRQRVLGLELLALAEQVTEVVVAQRRGEVEQALLLAVVPHRQHVRVGDALRRVGLALEALAELVVVGQPARQHLDRRRPVVLEVDGLEDPAHAALGELRVEPEAAPDEVTHPKSGATRQRHVCLSRGRVRRRGNPSRPSTECLPP